MNLILLMIVATVTVVSSQSTNSTCGRVEIEPLKKSELNVDGTISGAGIKHNVQGIVNGETARRHSIPWQVMLHADGGLCGGSILSLDWVVTAAHCIGSRDARKYTMFFGQHDSRGEESTKIKCQASAILVHNLYEGSSQSNDIALLRIDHSSCTAPLRFSYAIQPICLPDVNDEFEDEAVFAMVSGWGTTKSGGDVSRYLMKTVVKMHTLSECQRLYARYGGVAEHSICGSAIKNGKPTDSCQGDSGGPLAVRTTEGTWKLAGIVSWGIGCADKNNPGVYTEVPAFLEWIHKHTGLGSITKTSSTTESPTNTKNSTSIKPLTIVCSPSHIADGVVIYSTSTSCNVFDIVPTEAHEMMAHVIEEYTGYERDGECFKVTVTATKNATECSIQDIRLENC